MTDTTTRTDPTGHPLSDDYYCAQPEGDLAPVIMSDVERADLMRAYGYSEAEITAATTPEDAAITSTDKDENDAHPDWRAPWGPCVVCGARVPSEETDRNYGMCDRCANDTSDLNDAGFPVHTDDELDAMIEAATIPYDVEAVAAMLDASDDEDTTLDALNATRLAAQAAWKANPTPANVIAHDIARFHYAQAVRDYEDARRTPEPVIETSGDPAAVDALLDASDDAAPQEAGHAPQAPPQDAPASHLADLVAWSDERGWPVPDSVRAGLTRQRIDALRTNAPDPTTNTIDAANHIEADRLEWELTHRAEATAATARLFAIRADPYGRHTHGDPGSMRFPHSSRTYARHTHGDPPEDGEWVETPVLTEATMPEHLIPLDRDDDGYTAPCSDWYPEPDEEYLIHQEHDAAIMLQLAGA